MWDENKTNLNMNLNVNIKLAVHLAGRIKLIQPTVWDIRTSQPDSSMYSNFNECTFLTRPHHQIYRVEAVDLKSSNYT